MSYNSLFSPFKVKDLEIKNRVILPAMMTKMASPTGLVTQNLIDYHVAIAKGGCGLNFTEVCAIHKSTHGNGYLALYNDEHFEGMKNLIDNVHNVGGKIGVQIWHGGQVAIALLPKDRTPMVTEGMTHEDIKEIVNCYGKSTKMAVAAGCDAIEFHAAHTYLPHTFLSAAFNKRDDEYSGSLENRARFSLEVIRTMRANMPETMPLFMRVDALDDYVQNGLTIEDVIEFLKMAKAEGVDIIDISRGNNKSAALKYEVPSIDTPRGYNIENVKKIRDAIKIPVVGVGRINHPEIANKFIEEEKCDLVAIGRGQITDHEFCNKAKDGKADSIRLCVGCLKGCFDSIMNPNIPTITCMRNPMVGKEGQPITKTTNPKTVLIAGGGMGGMMTANMLKVRGHNPILCEASNKLGGQFNLAGAAPYKGEMLDAVDWETKEATRLCVDVRLNTVVTPELVSKINPDEVIIATGAVASKPKIKGIESKNVFTYEEVLSGNVELSGNVVILGGKMVGLETAQYLTNKGIKCTIIDEAERLGGDLGWIRSMNILENMYVIGVNQVTSAKIIKIKENEVVYIKDETENSVNCDAVVIALGATSVALEDVQLKCRDLEIPFHIIGDAKSPRVALNTTLEGIEIALNLDSENALNV